MVSEITEERVVIPCGTIFLDGLLGYPEDRAPGCALLLVNPHPHLGGNMKNNVIRHIAFRGAQDGAVTLRFDYRGIGGSGMQPGESRGAHQYYADIEAEQQYEKMLPDCMAAAEWMKRTVRGVPFVYVGYSLGALLASLLAARMPPEGLVAIGPPNRRVSMNSFEACACRKLFIAGDDDFVFDGEAFQREYETLAEPKSFHILSGSGHFFRGREEEVYNLLFNAILA